MRKPDIQMACGLSVDGNPIRDITWLISSSFSYEMGSISLEPENHSTCIVDDLRCYVKLRMAMIKNGPGLSKRT